MVHTIIHGTKDIVIKLSRVNINHQRSWWLVTGNVVAFYPNIPLQRYMDIVYQIYEEYLWQTMDPCPEIMKTLLKVFKQCLYIGNTQLMCKFQNQFYEQLQGLVIGVADSPDMANLYRWFFETEAEIDNNSNIPFYGYYIDDCLAIIYAESAEQAVQYMSNKIKFDNCTILWEVSEGQAFLDMFLYKDLDGKLQYKPYQKARNHKERIPWISHHPLNVK